MTLPPETTHDSMTPCPSEVLPPHCRYKISVADMYELLKNIEPPVGFGKNCPYRLAYRVGGWMDGWVDGLVGGWVG